MAESLESDNVRDSYERFFEQCHITKAQFIEFGLRETIYAPIEPAKESWENLKNRIDNNQTVYIRGFGRDAGSTELFFDFYKNLVNNSNVKKDPTNNAEPTKLIKSLTGYSKSKSPNYKLIQNYQISHIFGKTKNIYAFTSPWNLAYIPKILDPFTGHEAKGDLVEEYSSLFREKSYQNFKPLIEEYNEIMTSPSFLSKIARSLMIIEELNIYEEKAITKLRKSITEELSPIEV